MDICVVSSGIYDERLSAIAAENNWSYLSMEKNQVALAQNVALLLHPAAEYIYKMDEDIFLTAGALERMRETHDRVTREGLYDVGFVAPLIPINGYGHVRILERLGLTATYAERFEPVKYASYNTRQIERNPEVARFMWGEGGTMPTIDAMAARFGAEDFSYSVCPVRFSIGCILFRREIWERMGMWHVARRGPGMGDDEGQICTFAICQSQAIVVAENALVGHLSFGQQNAAMREYHATHGEVFALPDRTASK